MKQKPIEERGINPRNSGEVDMMSDYSEHMTNEIRSVLPGMPDDCPDCENRPVFRKNCKTCKGMGKKHGR